MNNALRLASLDYVEYYASDLNTTVDEMTAQYGFSIAARSIPRVTDHKSVTLRQNDIQLMLTEGVNDSHPASSYVRAHGDGLGNIVFRTPDVRAAFAAAVAAGARPLLDPVDSTGYVTAAIEAFGDVRHTFIQYPATPGAGLPGFVPVAHGDAATSTGLRRVDHLAVCVEAGQLTQTVDFYQSALGFQKIFEEQITVGTQAMNSQVVRNAAGDVTLTIIEPDTTREPGQIDRFIKNHGGAGVQHLAFSADDVIRTVRTLQQHGIQFLNTPDSYYERLPERMTLGRRDVVSELQSLGVLADSDHAGQLYQIFTHSTHPRSTFFMEVIERMGATTFGSGNIKALYEAVEHERATVEPSR